MTKKVTDAHRVVYSFATCIPITDVPKLQRCTDDRCVSPHHVFEIGSTIAQRSRSRAGLTAADTNLGQIDIDVAAVLQAKQPATWMDDFTSIEEECGLPTGSLTMPVWLQYVEANPDDDDD